MSDTFAKEEAFFAAVFLPGYKTGQIESFRGYAKSLSGTNSEGVFDVLPEHENFVTLISGPFTIVDLDGKNHLIRVERAVLEASDNLVKIFVEF